LKEGFLTKSDPSGRSVKRRWFLLQDNLLYYFEAKKKTKPLGTILFSNIRDVKLGDEPNSFLIVTDERTYPLIGENETDVLGWLNPIKILTKLHNSRNEYTNKTGFADTYKHQLITNAKKALTDTIKITGITKALVGKRANKARAEQIIDDVYNQNDILGKAAFAGCASILSAMEDIFSQERLVQMCEALNNWKSIIPNVIKYAEGTPNQPAADATYKMIVETLDLIMNLERPSPVFEIAQSLDVLFLKLTQYLFCQNQDDRQEKAKELRAAATEFINSANYVSSALPPERRSEALRLAEKIPDEIANVMDAVKNAHFFSDEEHQIKAEEAKEIFRNTVRQLAELYEQEFGKSVRKPAVVKEIGSSNSQDKSMEQILTE